MALILEAQPILNEAIQGLKKRVENLSSLGINPCLKVILVGHNPASLSYIKSKIQLSGQVGIRAELIQLPDDASIHEVQNLIQSLNAESTIHGILIQLPLPKHLANLNLEKLISVEKDVDGFSLTNLGALFLQSPQSYFHIPCTPKGILRLLQHYKIPLAGKKVCIVGRSMIVGRPMALLALRENATVEICHSQSSSPEKLAQNADILIAAIGKARHIGPDWCHPDQIVIDVGINRDSSGKLCGDVDFNSVAPIVKAITPVPGGVGKLTVLSLIENLIEGCESRVHMAKKI